jgi:hypothetical protein
MRDTFDTINWNMASSILKYSVMYCVFALQFFQLSLMGPVRLQSYLILINMRFFCFFFIINPLNAKLNPHLPSAGIIKSSPYSPC